MDSYNKYGLGKRNLKYAKHWQILDIKNTRIVKPTLLCFGGNGTTYDTVNSGEEMITGPERANGICGIAERLIVLKDDDSLYSSYKDVDFLGFYYGKKNKAAVTGELEDNEIKEIVKYLFLPLAIDDNCKRLDTTTAP